MRLSINSSTTTQDSVAVVVLNWNGKDDTLSCLHSLSQISLPTFDIIVVDNGSTDGSERAIRSAFPGLVVLQTQQNLGYAGGNNVGIQYCLKRAIYDFVLILNNDTLVEPCFLEELLAATKIRPDCGIFGPKILFETSQKIWFAGGRWDPVVSHFVHFGEDEVNDGRFNTGGEVEFLTGCALLIRVELLETLGGFDERFFLTYEDGDLCFRARAVGSRCLFVPKSTILHKVSASLKGGSPLGSYFWNRNRFLFAEIHLSWRQRLGLTLNFLIEALVPPIVYGSTNGASSLRRAYWLLRSEGLWSVNAYRDPYYRARLYGTLDYLRRRFGDCPPTWRRRFVKPASSIA